MGLKEDYQEKLEAQLREWSGKIDQLKTAAEKLAADAQVTYHQQIDALRGKQEAAQKKLHELKEAGEGAWEFLKAGIDRAWDELKQGMEGALSRFKGEADREEEIRLIAYRIWEEEGVRTGAIRNSGERRRRSGKTSKTRNSLALNRVR